MAREIRNYAWTTGRELPVVVADDVLEGYNFAQREPHTRIFPLNGALHFKNCLLLNCDLPPGSTTEDCNRSQVSLCSHLHEKWVDKGLPECAEDCSHVVDTDEIRVDGVLIDTVRHYQDKGVA